jgi:predicted AAA+ superfamily ATPase
MQGLLDRNNLVQEAVLRLGESPVVALLGARQVGKTTLARMVAKQWPDATTVFDLETARGTRST